MIVCGKINVVLLMQQVNNIFKFIYYDNDNCADNNELSLSFKLLLSLKLLTFNLKMLLKS